MVFKLFKFACCLFSICFFSITYSKDKKIDPQMMIGPVYNPPVKVNNDLYILSSSGVLIKSDLSLTKVQKIFSLEKQSMSGIVHDNGHLYFGEGIHDDKSIFLYQFDLIKKKLKNKLKLDGHIEKTPFISNGFLYAPLGPGGMAKIKIPEMTLLWSTQKISDGNLHIDSTPFEFGSDVCAATIYELKGVVCLNKESGVKSKFFPLTSSPKGDISRHHHLAYGLATEATPAESKFDIPGIFYVVDLEKGQIKTLPLRGHNFFSFPVVEKNKALVSLSTGDIILISLDKLTIEFIGEFPEPLLTSPFVYKEQYCAAGLMGKILCYKNIKGQFALAFEERIMNNFIGTVGEVNHFIYIPTRTGHHLLK